MRSSGSVGLQRRPSSRPTAATGRHATGATNALFLSVLALLFAMGWAANHFVALMPLISDHEHLSTAALDATFGVYALGLLPGLLVGGRASDAVGRRSVALAGSVSALIGTTAMLLSQQPEVLLGGRLVVGMGVGLAMSSGTAWASDLKGPPGVATAGAVLIGGFAVGPLAGGVAGGAGQPGIRVSFAIAAAVLVLAMAAMAAAVRWGAPVPATPPAAAGSISARQGTTWALGWAMPLAPWVFASATLGFVTIPARIHTALAAPMAAGIATLVVNGISGVIQVVARIGNWGPQAGTAGAVLAAIGYVGAVVAPPTMSSAIGLPLLLILGCASGLCLREGLIDLQIAAPARLRGALVGSFYVVTYVGFGLPLLLTLLGSRTVSAVILLTMAALALAAAASRAVRLRRGSHRPTAARGGTDVADVSVTGARVTE
ncbi:MFS transporter [Mycobacterium sp. 050134]|uniref:MFS transporter n=1 Tax=Mycobacterium sp. 050134 TaxID=3096111 RepID=UPI002ED8417F